MDNRYHRHNRRKYSLKVHIVLVTKYRKQLLRGAIDVVVKQKIQSIADVHHYEIVAMETDKDHVHILLGYDTTDSVCNIVKTQNKKQHIIFGKDSDLSCLNTIGRKGYSGPMDTLPVVSGKFPQQLSKSTSKAKDDASLRTGLLPPRKGSGFPPKLCWRYFYENR